MRKTTIIFAGCLTLMTIAAGCVGTVHSSDYRSFPQINFLLPNQARPVTSFPAARTNGHLSEGDWRTIVGILSRIPRGAIPDELKIMHVAAESNWQTVCVHIQIGGNYMVVFVKVNKTDWIVAGIHEFVI